MNEIYRYTNKSLHEGIMNYLISWSSDSNTLNVTRRYKSFLYSLNFNTCDLKEVNLINELMLSNDSNNIKIAIEIINTLNGNNNRD